MRVLVCGDRKWSDMDAIKRELAKLPPDTIIIHGDCIGADRIAGHYAARWGWRTQVYPADWLTHGKAAGPIRNRQMLTEGKPDLVLAFHTDISKSHGTADMVRAARQAGVEVRIFGH